MKDPAIEKLEHLDFKDKADYETVRAEDWDRKVNELSFADQVLKSGNCTLISSVLWRKRL